MDLGVTYKGLDNQQNAAANLNGAAAEARIKPLAIQQQINIEVGKLGAELRDNGKTDTGPAVNAGGAAGMFGKAMTSMAVTAAVSAVAGPAIGGAVGFGLAVKDSVQSMAKSAQPDEASGYYTLKRSMQEFQKSDVGADTTTNDSFQYANDGVDDPIIQHYQAACDPKNVCYVNGFATAAPAALTLEALKTDSAETRNTKERIGSLQQTMGEHENTMSTVNGLAPKMGVVVAEGPKAPVGMGAPVFGMA